MAHRATPGLPGTRKYLPAKSVVAVAVILALALSGVFWAKDAMTAQAITFNGMRPPIDGYTPARDALAGVNTSQDWAAVAYSQVSKRAISAQLHKVENVRARAYLRVVIHVRDMDATPLRNQQVMVAWRAGGVSTVESVITNDRGDANLLHWIPASDKGQTVVVSAWTNTPDWANGTYAWFVPR